MMPVVYAILKEDPLQNEENKVVLKNYSPQNQQLVLFPPASSQPDDTNFGHVYEMVDGNTNSNEQKR